MSKRESVTSDTIQAVAAQYAGQGLDPTRAEAYLAYAEPIYQMFEGLRALPLKDVEPAIVFQPVEGSES
ncbi:MAG: hypothetical protein QF609_13005 [Gammaproteobacteria bacterium]|jgi:hypothetical protein|nr:hypothetical protein [Gammaproteobacteria bacterium]HJP34636.1 hypothetical protein [Gammaproteobacteria bacterium]